jgi:crossover junction endodeoxyribonuclease RusA
MGGALLELPWPPNELSGHHNVHWRVLQPIKKKHRTWAAMATLAADIRAPEGQGDIFVSATFYPPNKRTDRVNMPGRMKAYWDGIADALKVNDRRFLPTFHFAEPVKNPRVVVRIGL